eukprot:SAG25_NODE_7648_length_469_cov_0.951351_2_plen_82_part_01
MIFQLAPSTPKYSNLGHCIPIWGNVSVRVALWRVCVVSAPRVMAKKLTRGVLCGRAVLPELFPPPPSSSIVTPSPTPPPSHR